MEIRERAGSISESDWLAATLVSLERLAADFGLPAPRLVGTGESLPPANGGYVTITGEHVSHTVGIAATDAHSRHLVAQTFGYVLSDLKMGDIADAMGELANMLVGSVKATLASRADDLVAGLPWFLSGQLWVASSEATTATVRLGDIEVLAVVIRQPSSLDHVERRRMESAIADREARLRAILDSAVGGILTVDARGFIESFNVAAQRILACSEQEATGQHVNTLFGTDVLVHLLRLSSTTKREQGLLDAIELRANRATGEAVFIEVTAARFAVRDRNLVVGVFRDITYRKQLEVELRQAQKLESVGRLASGIAHEFNTPLQYVSDNLGFVLDTLARFMPLFELRKRLLAHGVKPPEPATRLALYEEQFAKLDIDCIVDEIPAALSSSIEGLGRIASLVRAMREFSRPSEGYLAPEDLRELIETTVAVCRCEWDFVSDLVTDYDPLLPAVPCIRDELSHALLNIVINAAHAIEMSVSTGRQRRGRISISTHRHESSAEIRVSDTGNGITDVVKPHIFEPFFTTKAVGKGAGQGLAIAHNVVARHRGHIEVESTPGEVTTFRIFIPLTQTQESPAAQADDL